MMQRNFPEDWVHDTGRLVIVGSAAHPFPVRYNLRVLRPGGNHLLASILSLAFYTARV